jgi:uncharacterized protein YbaR (Trm112 family)
MTVPDELLQILVCPVCKKKVLLSGEGCWLVCESCRLRYPVREGIPVMLVDEAEETVKSEG